MRVACKAQDSEQDADCEVEFLNGSGSPGRKNSSRQQEVADLHINNEALLCMLERERQHSHQLERRLQQVEADALEVSCLLVRTQKFPSLIHPSLITSSKG